MIVDLLRAGDLLVLDDKFETPDPFDAIAAQAAFIAWRDRRKLSYDRVVIVQCIITPVAGRTWGALEPVFDRAHARFHNHSCQVHVGTIVDGKPASLCGVMDPKYLTGWPAEPLSPNGPAGCPACLDALARGEKQTMT